MFVSVSKAKPVCRQSLNGPCQVVQSNHHSPDVSHKQGGTFSDRFALNSMHLISIPQDSIEFPDILLPYRKTGFEAGDRLLIGIGLCVFLIHCLALYFVKFEADVYMAPDLKIVLGVTLNKAPPTIEEIPVVDQTDFPLEPVDETGSSPGIATVSPEIPPSDAAQEPVVDTVSKQEKLVPLNYRSFGKIIRNESNKERKKIISFSTADFPGKKVTPDYYRSDAIQTLVSAPRTVVYQDVQGYSTILTDDGFGNITCMQERGFKGDANPPLWYPVPAKTCGHLK